MNPRMTDVVFPPTFETTASFTPGPWKYIPSHIAEGPSEVRHADGWLICCTCSDEFARLIAAAPELLAALKLVREFNCKHAPALLHLPLFRSMDAAVFAAIAAAKGGAL